MKNKILLILFSLFALAVPKQVQTMSSVKNIAHTSLSFLKKNQYEVSLMYFYMLLNMQRSSYDNIFFLKHNISRIFLKFFIGSSICSSIRSRNVPLEVIAKVFLALNLLREFGEEIRGTPEAFSLKERLLFEVLAFAGMFKFIRFSNPEALKYTFVLLVCLYKHDIINFVHNNLSQ